MFGHRFLRMNQSDEYSELIFLPPTPAPLQRMDNSKATCRVAEFIEVLINWTAWWSSQGHTRSDTDSGSSFFLGSPTSLGIGPGVWVARLRAKQVAAEPPTLPTLWAAVLLTVSTLSKISYRQRSVMESQTGMSPKLPPESLKMSLPGINCHDSKINGRSRSICSSSLFFMIVSLASCLPLFKLPLSPLLISGGLWVMLT